MLMECKDGPGADAFAKRQPLCAGKLRDRARGVVEIASHDQFIVVRSDGIDVDVNTHAGGMPALDEAVLDGAAQVLAVGGHEAQRHRVHRRRRLDVRLDALARAHELPQLLEGPCRGPRSRRGVATLAEALEETHGG
jgi:hypothetical protein